MLINKSGDLLKATENIICHQCNTEGIFGGGLAYQIKGLYPNCEISAINHVKTLKDKCEVVGTYNVYPIDIDKTIANCFTQDKNFNTNYDAIETVFSSILEYCQFYKKTIAIPYKYGCGIAHGNWDEVSKIFEKISNKYDVDISVYRKEDINE